MRRAGADDLTLLIRTQYQANFLSCGTELRPVCDYWSKRIQTGAGAARTLRVFFGRTRRDGLQEFRVRSIRRISAQEARGVSAVHAVWVPLEVAYFEGECVPGRGAGKWRRARSRKASWVEAEAITEFFAISVFLGRRILDY